MTQLWLGIVQHLARWPPFFISFLQSVCLGEHLYKIWEKSIWYFYHARATLKTSHVCGKFAQGHRGDHRRHSSRRFSPPTTADRGTCWGLCTITLGKELVGSNQTQLAQDLCPTSLGRGEQSVREGHDNPKILASKVPGSFCRRTWNSHWHEDDPARQARRRPKVSSAPASSLRSPWSGREGTPANGGWRHHRAGELLRLGHTTGMCT